MGMGGSACARCVALRGAKEEKGEGCCVGKVDGMGTVAWRAWVEEGEVDREVEVEGKTGRGNRLDWFMRLWVGVV